MELQAGMELRPGNPASLNPAAQLPEAVRKDAAALAAKIAAIKTQGEVPLHGEEAVQQVQEAGRDGCDWSLYVGNLITQAMPAIPEALVEIDFSLLLNWMPAPEKTLEENLQDLAWCYQELWCSIIEKAGGEQQMALLARLDQIMMGKLEVLFRLDLGKLYDFFTDNGEPDVAARLLPSLQRAGLSLAHGQQRSDAARQGRAASAAMPRGAAESARQPAALKRGSGAAPRTFPAAQHQDAASRHASRSPGGAPAGNGFFAPREMRTAARFVERLAPPDYGTKPDAEWARILEEVDAGLAAMKTEAFFRYGDLSPELAAPLRRAMERFLTAAQPQQEQEPRENTFDARQESGSGRRPAMFSSAAARGRSHVAQVAAQMAQTFVRTGDAREAILAGVRFARVLTARGEQPDRESERLFWKAILYGAGVGESAGRKPPLQLMRENWNGFVRSTELRRSRGGDLYWNAYATGGLQHWKKGVRGENGMIPAALAVFLFVPAGVTLLAGRPALALVLFGLAFCAALALWKR